MRIERLVLAVACLLLPLVVPAQPTEPDIVGIWFDEDAVSDCLDSAEPLTRVTAHLILCNVSTNGILGWECAVDFVSGQGLSSVSHWFVRGYHMMEYVPPNFAIGFYTPMPWAPALVLLDMEVFWQGEECWFYVGPSTIPSIPGWMAYLNGENVSEIREMFHPQGDPSLPVARMSTNCTVAVEGASWGAVRRLFH